MWENPLKENNKCCEAPGGAGHNPDCHFKVRSLRYTDFRATVQYIYKNEGLLAFTKGVLPRMGINVPSTALSWGTYELIKSFLNSDKTGAD